MKILQRLDAQFSQAGIRFRVGICNLGAARLPRADPQVLRRARYALTAAPPSPQVHHLPFQWSVLQVLSLLDHRVS